MGEVLESRVEEVFKEKVKAIGGLCYKFQPSVKGLPDRIVIHKGKVYFVELKRSKERGQVSPIQVHVLAQLNAHGADARLLWGVDDVLEFIEEVSGRGLHTIQLPEEDN